MSKKNTQSYVVCCEPRVVLHGWATPTEIKKEHPTLTDARMLVYWDDVDRGLFGVIRNGPSDKCRVSPAVYKHTILTKVECVAESSFEADARWEAEPWG